MRHDVCGSEVLFDQPPTLSSCSAWASVERQDGSAVVRTYDNFEFPSPARMDGLKGKLKCNVRSKDTTRVGFTMRFEDLLQFLERDMRMSHVYQSVMIRALLDRNGRASVADIARALLTEDRSQLEYYSEITKNMVGRVLARRGIVRRDGKGYELLGYADLTQTQVQDLKMVCDKKLADYVARRGNAIWEHRRRSAGYISGTLRYEVLKNAKFHCELCGVAADERALEVDHIIPRSQGGQDDITNLQALCYQCNAMKRDRDTTDFRAVRATATRVEPDCPFCATSEREVLLQNNLAAVLRDSFPASEWRLLIIPKRHTEDYFDLSAAEVRACHQLVTEARSLVLGQDSTVCGFNVGTNNGEVAGQTVMHCHIHLIPRRAGDNPNPRGGVRGVIPGKADYKLKNNDEGPAA